MFGWLKSAIEFDKSMSSAFSLCDNRDDVRRIKAEMVSISKEGFLSIEWVTDPVTTRREAIVRTSMSVYRGCKNDWHDTNTGLLVGEYRQIWLNDIWNKEEWEQNVGSRVNR